MYKSTLAKIDWRQKRIDNELKRRISAGGFPPAAVIVVGAIIATGRPDQTLVPAAVVRRTPSQRVVTVPVEDRACLPMRMRVEIKTWSVVLLPRPVRLPTQSSGTSFPTFTDEDDNGQRHLSRRPA